MLSWVYQEILVFYYKKVPQNGENAYLVIKNPRASRALRWALDPSQLGLTSFTQFHCVKLVKKSKIFSLGPPLQKAGYGPVSDGYSILDEKPTIGYFIPDEIPFAFSSVNWCKIDVFI